MHPAALSGDADEICLNFKGDEEMTTVSRCHKIIEL